MQSGAKFCSCNNQHADFACILISTVYFLQPSSSDRRFLGVQMPCLLPMSYNVCPQLIAKISRLHGGECGVVSLSQGSLTPEVLTFVLPYSWLWLWLVVELFSVGLIFLLARQTRNHLCFCSSRLPEGRKTQRLPLYPRSLAYIQRSLCA